MIIYVKTGYGTIKEEKRIQCRICIDYYLIFHQKIHKSNFMLKFISVKNAKDIKEKLTDTQTICCKIKKNKNKNEEINLNKTNYNN